MHYCAPSSPCCPTCHLDNLDFCLSRLHDLGAPHLPLYSLTEGGRQWVLSAPARPSGAAEASKRPQHLLPTTPYGLMHAKGLPHGEFVPSGSNSVATYPEHINRQIDIQCLIHSWRQLVHSIAIEVERTSSWRSWRFVVSFSAKVWFTKTVKQPRLNSTAPWLQRAARTASWMCPVRNIRRQRKKTTRKKKRTRKKCWWRTVKGKKGPNL